MIELFCDCCQKETDDNYSGYAVTQEIQTFYNQRSNKIEISSRVDEGVKDSVLCRECFIKAIKKTTKTIVESLEKERSVK